MRVNQSSSQTDVDWQKLEMDLLSARRELKRDFETAWSQLVSNLRDKLVLLDAVLVKPAETLSEVPAQRDGEDVDEAEQSEGVEQHHCVLQEG